MDAPERPDPTRPGAPDTGASKPPADPSRFPRTQWTEVIEVLQRGSADAAFAALTEFCQQYRPAIVAFFRQRGCSPEQAEDYTQDFLTARVLKPWDGREGFLHAAKRGAGGGFRAFLLHVLWWFLKDKWKASRSARGGGTVPHVPWEEGEFDVDRADPEWSAQFGWDLDRVFAKELVERVAAQSTHAPYLLEHLRDEISQAEAARRAGVSEGALKQAYDRFKTRLSDALMEEATRLAPGAGKQEIRAEVGYLVSLYCRGGT